MASCFLFIEQFDEQQLLSLRLNQQGDIESPLAVRTLDQFKALQVNAKTIIVLPTERCSLHNIALPWLGERKARAALPFALEEQLAQNVNDLHVAFDKNHYQNNHYLVAVIDSSFFSNLLETLTSAGISVDVITIDWFALKPNEACVSQTSLVVSSPDFKGALGPQLATNYLEAISETVEVYVFADSLRLNLPTTHEQSTLSFYEWTAKRLVANEPLNLCQGALQPHIHNQGFLFWYKASGAALALWILSVIVINAMHSHQLSKETATIDKKIAVIYKAFFPESTQVISPKFRIGQKLKSGLADDGQFWQLFNALAQSFKAKDVVIEQLRFQSQTLFVSLVTNDFVTLEAFEQRLKQAGVNVSQTQASTIEQKVAATLELRL